MEITEQRLQMLKALKEAQEDAKNMTPEELDTMRREHVENMGRVDWELAARQGRLEACLQGAKLTKKSLIKGRVSLPLTNLSIFLSLTNSQWNRIHTQAFDELKSKPKRFRSEFKLFVLEVRLAREMYERDEFPLRYRLSTQLQLNLEEVN